MVASGRHTYRAGAQQYILRIVHIMKVDFCNFNQCDYIYTTTCFVNTLDDHYNHMAYKLLRGAYGC